MKIINLIENTKGQEECLYEHGLSFYIETEKHKILMDTGSTDAFIHNASVLGVELTQVDTVIVSHGHYDHAGGVMAFAEVNPCARIYMQQSAGRDYIHLKEDQERYIGINKQILELPQLQMLDGDLTLDEEAEIFTGVTGRRMWAKSNRELKCKGENGLVQDTFDHEQYLRIRQDGRQILLSGCAHNGILNILDAYKERYQQYPDIVISGFHMAQKREYDSEDIRMIQDTARELKQTGAVFYSGHCTGKTAFQIMKEIMGDSLRELHSGMAIGDGYE